MSSGSIRIIQLPEKSSVNTDDYMAVDSFVNGTKKVKFTDLLDSNLSAQNKAADAKATGEAISRLNTDINTEKLARQSTDNNLQAQIDQLVAPSGTAPNPAEIENARIGADGVTYDTLGNAIRTQFTNVKSEISETDEEVFSEIPFAWELGGLSTTSGNPVDSDTRIRTDFIPAKVGDHYVVADSENLLMFYEYDANKTLTRVSASGNFWYEAVSRTDAFIRIVMRKDTSNSTITQADIPTITAKLSPNTKKESKIIPLEESVDELKEELYNTESWDFESETVGKYVNLSGTESTNGSFNISKPINLSKGDSVDFFAMGYETVVGMISEVTGTNTYRVLVRSSDSTLHTYTYTATSDITIALCYNNGYSHSCEIKRLNYMQKGSAEIYPNYISLFKNCACIGDSLTRGYQAEMPSGERNRDGGYPTRLSRMTRLNVYNFGLSGATPTDWLANTTLADYDYSGFDVALVCLGRNGSLSSETDQQSYATIINKLKTANPNMTIFCLSLPPSDSDDTAINAIIENIAENNNAYYVDISNNTELSNSAFRYDGVHYYPLGYDLLADLIKQRVCKYINDNKSTFMRIYTPKTYPDVIAGLVE